MIDHDILRFDISVHDTNRMTIMQAFQNLIQVVFTLFRFDNLQ